LRRKPEKEEPWDVAMVVEVVDVTVEQHLTTAWSNILLNLF
jgi:hypothetical protein